MSRESFERGAQLAAILARATALPPNVIARHVCHLQRIARQAKAICERQANGYAWHYPVVGGSAGWDSEAEARDVRREESLIKHGATIAKELGDGFAVKVGGDPRGPCCWLKIPGVPGDGWDRDAGHAIY